VDFTKQGLGVNCQVRGHGWGSSLASPVDYFGEHVNIKFRKGHSPPYRLMVRPIFFKVAYPNQTCHCKKAQLKMLKSLSVVSAVIALAVVTSSVVRAEESQAFVARNAQINADRHDGTQTRENNVVSREQK
jgi:hypothetical protein